MRILIIEDEAQAAWMLRQTILNVQPDATIAGVVESIADIKEWFDRNEAPDLIFSDIQLGDGIVFDAFRNLVIPCPVIFCTAFDEYLLQAFKANGIDYLLKPIDEREVRQSFEKVAVLKKSLAGSQQNAWLNKAILEMLGQKSAYKSNFLVPHRDRLIPVDTSNIGYFKVTDTSAEIGLLNGKTYQHNFSLDYLATVLNPVQFHRANRQYLVSFDAIREIEHHDDRKLLVHLKEPCNEKIIVSKAKAAQFLHWVRER